MEAQPSYLPLLRRIVNAECNAEQYLSAWASATPRADVRQVIATVALREGEHTKAFQKRIGELGFDVSIEEAPQTAGRVAIAGATDLTDREKFEKLGLGTPPDTSAPDRWADYFADTSIDIGTGELLGRFISEERDSVRLLAGCYAALCAEEGGPSDSGPMDRIERLLEQLVARLDDAVPVPAASSSTTEAEFRAALRRDGFDDEIRITNYDAGVPGAELHAHEFSARLLVLDGVFILRTEGEPLVLHAGECCNVDAGMRHSESTGDAPARVLAGLKHHR